MNKIILGDCLEVMRGFADEIIDLTVTSPPYDNLRTYNGYSFDFDPIARELYRVTKQGGVVVWVVGDSTVDGSESGTSFKQALYFKDCGFNLHDTMIYKKLNYPPLTHNRYEQEFEYMFVLSKGKPKTFNPTKVASKHLGKVHSGSFYHTKKQGKPTKANGTPNVNEQKIHGNIFEYYVGGLKYGHPAPFPKKLVKDHINTWTNEGDHILDPFAGSGTTLRAAKDLNRKCTVIEISPEYIEIIKKRERQEVLL